MHRLRESKRMRGMKNSFRAELVKEIRKRFSLQVILVSFILFFLLLFLVMFMQSYQLHNETKTIVKDFTELKEEAFTSLEELNKGTIPQYLKNNSHERYLYQQFYEKTASLGEHTALKIITQEGELLFESGRKQEDISSYFLQTVLKNNRSKKEFTKVAQGKSGQHYLLFFSKINDTSDYSLLVINGGNFLPVGLQYGTQFIIADNFNNVYAKNTSHFVTGSLEKVESKKLSRPIYIESGKFYLMKKKQLNTNLVLYTFLLSFPMEILILFGLLSMVLVTSILLIQSNHLAKTIGDKTTREIDLLVAETSKIRDGKQKVIQLETNEEFQYLVDSINTMVEELDHMMVNQLHLEKQNSVFERKMLEAQFNPHFLYNTLETIRIMIQIDPPLADKLILSLNRVLRYSIDYADEETTLEDDLDILADFLQVNAVRFEKFRFNISCEPKMKSLVVPRLFLLPLVENTLKYGMRYKNDLRVQVVCRRTSEGFVFSVTDDGPGFSEETIKNILNPRELDTHHGLNNSLRRLQMLYPNTRLTIVNHELGATVSFICLEENHV